MVMVDQVNGINQFILWLFRRFISVVFCVDFCFILKTAK